MDARPRMGRIKAAVAYSSFSRSRLYELAAVTPGLFRKDKTTVHVDFDVLDRILDDLPLAEIKSPAAIAERDAATEAA